MLHIGFLFNHRHHQIFHSVSVAFEISAHYPDIKVTIIAANSENFFLIKKLGGGFPGQQVNIIQSKSYWPLSITHQLLKGWFSFEKLMVRFLNQKLFQRFDALVVSEYTSLSLRHSKKLEKLFLIQIPHGAGDREVSFDKRISKFDFILLPGNKMRDRLAELGRLPKNHAIIGYPKFDLFARRKPTQLFDNERLTVLYNPHFSPAFSSWHHMGLAVLDYFYHSKEFNLIFAPHIMLFERRWKNKARLPARYKTCPHVLIDTGSHRSSDMTYTLSADLYMGDVSSQIYEFLIRPRPCIFLDPRNTEWQNNPYYYHWQFGAVLNDIKNLDAALQTAWKTHDKYKQKQKQGFAYTFDLTETRSSLRAANAIVYFLQNAKQNGKHL